MDESPYRAAPLVRQTPEEERARAALRPDLAPSEDLLWVGQPPRGVIFAGSDVVQVPFTAMWTAFVCFWNYKVWSTNAPLSFSLWGLPFLVVGFYGLVGRFFVDAQRRGRTFYGITTHRALLLEEGRTRKVTAIDLDRPGEFHLEERSDGSGTITFGHPLTAFGKSAAQKPPAFVRIAKAREVYAKLREAKSAARNRSAET